MWFRGGGSGNLYVLFILLSLFWGVLVGVVFPVSGSGLRVVVVEVYRPVGYDLVVEGFGEVYVVFGGETIYSQPLIYNYSFIVDSSSSLDVSICFQGALDRFRGMYPEVLDVFLSGSNYSVVVSIRDEFIDEKFVMDAARIFSGCVDKVVIYGALGGSEVEEFFRMYLDRWAPYNGSVIGYIDGKAVEIFSKYGELDTFFGLRASIRRGYEKALTIVVQADIRPTYDDIKRFIMAVREVVPMNIPIVLCFYDSPDVAPLVEGQDGKSTSSSSSSGDEELDQSIEPDEGYLEDSNDNDGFDPLNGGYPNLWLIVMAVVGASILIYLFLDALFKISGGA